MTPSTRTHIREIAEKLGYYPHSTAATYCHGLTLGTDLGIVGYDDIDPTRRSGFELSSINQIRISSLRRPSRRYSLHHLTSRRR